MHKLALLFSLALGLVVCGCEPCQHYNRLQVVAYAGPAAKRPYGSIRPYDKAQDVGHPFEVVGFMSCQASGADETAVLKAMLYRAADMGADAVLLNPNLVGSEAASSNAVEVPASWAAPIPGSNDRFYRAQAIRFK